MLYKYFVFRNSSSSRSSDSDAEMESGSNSPTPKNCTEDNVANTLLAENSTEKNNVNHTNPNITSGNPSTNTPVIKSDSSANPKEQTSNNHNICSNSTELNNVNSPTHTNINNHSSKDHNNSDLPKFTDNAKENSVTEEQTSAESLNCKASVIVNGTQAIVNGYANGVNVHKDYYKSCNGFDKSCSDLINDKKYHGKVNEKSGKPLVNNDIKNNDLFVSSVLKNSELFASQTVKQEGLVSIVHINGESTNGVETDEKVNNINSVIRPTLNGYNLSSLHNAELNLSHNPTTNGTVITHSKHATLINTTSPSSYTSLLEICQPLKPPKVCQDLASSQNDEVMELEHSQDDLEKNESDDDILICTVNEAADTQPTVVPAPTKVFESNSTLVQNGLNSLENKSLHKPATESNPALAVTNGLTDSNSVKMTPGILDNPAKNIIGSVNFTEITIKTDAYTNGCDNNLLYSQGRFYFLLFYVLKFLILHVHI